MGIRLHGGGMVTVLPKSTLPTFPLVIFLPRSPRYQLYRLWYNIWSLVVSYNEVNMVGGHGVVQDRSFKTLLCLKEPLQPSTLIPGKLQQEFSLMAPMSDVAKIAWKVMPIGSCHP